MLLSKATYNHSYTHSHMTVVSRAVRVRSLAQGHLDTQLGAAWDWTSNLPVACSRLPGHTPTLCLYWASHAPGQNELMNTQFKAELKSLKHAEHALNTDMPELSVECEGWSGDGWINRLALIINCTTSAHPAQGSGETVFFAYRPPKGVKLPRISGSHDTSCLNDLNA